MILHILDIGTPGAQCEALGLRCFRNAPSRELEENQQPSEVMMDGTWRRRKELLPVTTKWRWWIERDTEKETNELTTKKEDNNEENGIESLFRSTLLLAHENNHCKRNFLLFLISVFCFAAAWAACSRTITSPGPNKITAIQHQEEDDDKQ